MSSTVQQVLFHDSIDDAVATCVMALGGPAKVGRMLYPSLPPGRSEARVRENMNPERESNKFSPAEIEFIGAKAREVNCNALPEYLAMKWTCEFKPLEPAEAKKRAKSQRAKALLGEFARLLEAD